MWPDGWQWYRGGTLSTLCKISRNWTGHINCQPHTVASRVVMIAVLQIRLRVHFSSWQTGENAPSHWIEFNGQRGKERNEITISRHRDHGNLLQWPVQCGVLPATMWIARESVSDKQWKKEQVWPFFGCYTADSQTAADRHQLYNNGSLVIFSIAW